MAPVASLSVPPPHACQWEVLWEAPAAEGDKIWPLETCSRCGMARLSRMPSDQKVSIHTLPLHFGRVLTGSEGGQSRPEIDIPEILHRLSSEKLDVAGFVSHRGSLGELPEAIDGMRRGEVIHAIVRPE